MSAASEIRFPVPDRSEWEALVAKSLRGATADSLVYHTLDDIGVAPVYERAQAVADSLMRFPFTRSTSSTQNSRTGANYQGLSPAAANTLLKRELAGGVNHVNLALTGPTAIHIDGHNALDELLQNVHLDMIDLSVSTGWGYQAIGKAFEQLVDQHNLPRPSVTLYLNADPIGQFARQGRSPVLLHEAMASAAQLADSAIQSDAAGRTLTTDLQTWHNMGASEAQELGLLLACGKSYLQAMLDAGLDKDSACQQLAITAVTDADYFLSVAKLRAIRTLWARLMVACGTSPTAAEALIHVVTSRRMMSVQDPWVNILRTTVATSAALTGGCRSVTALPFDSILQETRHCQPSTLGRRIARNIPVILQEESGLQRVADPFGGSGYIEHLTSELCERGWSFFQSIEQQGGIVDALRNGFVQTCIDKSRAERQSRINHRKSTLIGINDFPLLEPNDPPQGEPLVYVDNDFQSQASENRQEHLSDHDAEQCTALGDIRDAQDFEALRSRSDKLTVARGVRPKVHLAAFGSPADYLARTQFSINLLAAGGLDTTQPSGQINHETFREQCAAAACTMAVLCTSPKCDRQTLEDLVGILRDSGVTTLVLAGKPDNDLDVDQSIYQGCNALAFLESTVAALEART